MKSTAYTVGPATSHYYMNGNHLEDTEEAEQNIPPAPDVPPPLPPKRTTSLVGTTAPRQKQSMRDAGVVTMNPKRISIATSTFWNGHPDLGHFVSGWEIGRDRSESSSVWGTTDRGGNESVDIWGDPPAVKKGILLQQRDKLLARWKERYCILTRDYLHCFRRSTSIHRSGVRLSEMGTFMFKLRLADVETIEWESRKSGPIIAILLPQESRLLLRTLADTYEALEQWYTLLQECIYMSKERRRALRNLHAPSSAVTTLQSHMSTLASSKASMSGGSGPHTPPQTTTSSSSNCSDGSSPNSSTKSKSTSTKSSSTHSSSQSHSSVEGKGPSSAHHYPQEGTSKSRANSSSSSSGNSFLKKNLGRMSLKLTPSNSKIDSVHRRQQVPQYHQQQQQQNEYAPLMGEHHRLDEEEDVEDQDADYEEAQDLFYNEINFPIHNNKKATRASIAVVEGVDQHQSQQIHRGRPTTMSYHQHHHHQYNHPQPPVPVHAGPSMTLHDFVKNPWKTGGTYSRGTLVSSAYSMPRDAVRHGSSSSSNSNNINNNNNNNHVSNSNRPESWNTQQFYAPVLSSGGWGGKSSSPPGGGGSFSRGRDSIYSTSRHTSEITFRKMS